MRGSSGGTYGNSIGKRAGFTRQDVQPGGMALNADQQKRRGDIDDVSDEGEFGDTDENVVQSH